MKTLFDLSWQVSEDEYRKDKAYSYSTLSKFNREGFNNLDKLFEKTESPALLFGSLVDTLLTDGQEEFDNKFLVADLPILSDNLVQIARKLFDNYNKSYRTIDLIPDTVLSSVGIDCGYYINSKYDAFRVKKIKEECSEYYNLMFLSTDKILVNSEDYKMAVNCVNELRTNPLTKFYFEDNNPFNKDIEKFYQLKFKGEYDGIKLRCMADLLIVNHKNKTIIPCDLKTTGYPEWDFYQSFIHWGYYIQAQLYWEIIKQNLLKDDVYKDYKLLDYKFIVINKNSLKPLVWTYPDTQVITDCFYGKDNKYKCRNWRNIVKELDSYLTNNYTYPMGICDDNDIKIWLNKE